MLGRLSVLCTVDEFGGEAMRFAEAIDTLQLLALWWVLLVIARVADGIGFLLATVDDFAVFITIEFAAIDNALFDE